MPGNTSSLYFWHTIRPNRIYKGKWGRQLEYRWCPTSGSTHCGTRRYASHPDRFSKSRRRGNGHHRSPFDFLIEKKIRGAIYGSYCSRWCALESTIPKSGFFSGRRKLGLWISANGRPRASATKVCPKPSSRHTGWTQPCMGEVWPLRPS